MIALRQITKSFQVGTQVLTILNAMDLTIRPEEFVSIMGPSGSGKSTLLSILGCLDTPDFGDYFLNQNNVAQLKEAELANVRNTTLGFVFQSFHLIPHYTALQNVALPLIYAGISHDERNQRAELLLQEVGLSHRLHHFPNTLSGGERQRVAVARALIHNPQVILADEPTGNLDSETGGTILTLLKKIHEKGKTVVIVTHDPLIAAYTQRTIRIQDGSVAA